MQNGEVLRSINERMKTYAIFLRGVTPTGKNRVPMAELRTALARAGLSEVQTYIQSGNVVAKSRLGLPGVESLVHETIKRDIGADIAVLARTHEQMETIMKQNPFPKTTASRTYFTLLSSMPNSSRLGDFLAIDFSPDKVKVMGNSIYTLYATKYSDSKFNNNFFERKLMVSATTRNHNTMSRLLELSA